MSKKISWLDKFAEEQAGKMEKTASSDTKTDDVIEQIILNREDIPNVEQDSIVEYKSVQYRVVNANYQDEKGEGLLLEKVSMKAPERAMVDPGNIYHIEVRDTVEEDKFREEAQKTEQQIASENAVDRTTPEGRYKKINPLLQRAVGLVNQEDEVEGDTEVVEGNTENQNDDVDEKTAKANQLAKRKKQAILNKKLLVSAKRVSSALEEEVEEILEHAEEVIKTTVPGIYVKASLVKLENILEKEGIEAKFDTRITRDYLRKTSSYKYDDDVLDEFIDLVANATVDELEDVLKDTDEYVDEYVNENIAKFQNDGFEVEAKIKNIIEKELSAKGVYFKLARNKSK